MNDCNQNLRLQKVKERDQTLLEMEKQEGKPRKITVKEEIDQTSLSWKKLMVVFFYCPTLIILNESNTIDRTPFGRKVIWPNVSWPSFS